MKEVKTATFAGYCTLKHFNSNIFFSLHYGMVHVILPSPSNHRIHTCAPNLNIVPYKFLKL